MSMLLCGNDLNNCIFSTSFLSLQIIVLSRNDLNITLLYKSSQIIMIIHKKNNKKGIKTAKKLSHDTKALPHDRKSLLSETDLQIHDIELLCQNTKSIIIFAL